MPIVLNLQLIISHYCSKQMINCSNRFQSKIHINYVLITYLILYIIEWNIRRCKKLNYVMLKNDVGLIKIATGFW